MIKKTYSKLTALALMCLSLGASAQPLHQPIPLYTNDGSCNRTGHSSYFVGSPVGGFMENTAGGIAVHAGTHYLVQNAYDNAGVDRAVVLVKKNGSNGAHLGYKSVNIGVALGSTASIDLCNGIVLDPVLNRAYVYGLTIPTTSAPTNAFVMCFNMTTLNLVSTFGTSGIAIVEYSTGSQGAIGMALTGSGSNFLVAINKAGGLLFEEFTSSASFVRSGNISFTGYSYEGYKGNMKKSSNGHYFLVGSSTNTTTSVKVPMVWDVMLNGTSTAYVLYSSSSPGSSTLGQGTWTDFDFYVNPANASLSGYLFDLVAVGNNLAENGIYARYTIRTAFSYVPQAGFTNQSGSVLPGIASPSNIPVTPIKFTKCVMAANGYLSVLGYFYTSFSSKALMGYITPTGNMYTTTYQAASAPSGCLGERIHKSAIMGKDLDGNILISGCQMGMTHTTIKLSNTYDCIPAFNNKGSSTTICQGDNAVLNVNVSTPGCTVTWRTLSPMVSTLYSGMPVSFIHTPSVTTTYECTVTNTATGCSAVNTFTVVVLPTSPGFSVTTNTSNPGYFTISALANETSASTVPGFGYAWTVEELDASNNVICTFSNPSCWWIPLTTPTVFNGLDFVTYNYTGLSTIANCSVPTIGKFEYGHRYRITRGTWSTDCPWKQQSVIIEITSRMAQNDMVIHSAESSNDVSVLNTDWLLLPQGALVYPNPNNGMFTIETQGEFTSNFTVFDASGKLIITKVNVGLHKQEMNLATLERGVYIVKFEVNGQPQSSRFIIAK